MEKLKYITKVILIGGSVYLFGIFGIILAIIVITLANRNGDE